MELSNKIKENNNINRMNLELRDSFIKSDYQRKILRNVFKLFYFKFIFIKISRLKN